MHYLKKLFPRSPKSLNSGTNIITGNQIEILLIIGFKINSYQISEHFQTFSIYVHVKIASIQEINR